MLAEGVYLSQVWMGSQISQKFLPAKIRPLTAHIKFTENCQAKCISCDYWKSRWEDSMDTARAIRLVHEVGDAGIRNLRFTGGEPFLRRDFFEILKQSNTAPFKRIVVQTNGLLVKKLHKEINDSPITKIALSLDGMKETNDQVRGIKGYFDLGIEGLKLLRGKEIAISVTPNRMSAKELNALGEMADSVGANIEINILSRSLSFFKNADLEALWPGQSDVVEIAKFVRDKLKRPAYETDYMTQYFNNETIEEPACVLGYLQVFVLSNGDVLTGCYPLKPVGNILKNTFAEVLASDAYVQQAEAMVRRECPGCTCGIESSLAMKHAASSAMFELSRLTQRPTNSEKAPLQAAAQS